ncbi:hypothetical protein AO265_39845 [Pseudomonas sp. ABAC61]|nr:hypothetical protein AO265_39845 [Pseudomonas sp. ABAC61]
MPTETQLEQRVVALQSDLNALDQTLDDAATENNERELSRRSWFDEALRLEKENKGLRSEVKRLGLLVTQADYNYDMDRAQFKRQLAERDALLHRIYEASEWTRDAAHYQEEVQKLAYTALSASAGPVCSTPAGTECPGDGVGKCKQCPGDKVNRDERAEFNAWLSEVVYQENTDNVFFKVQRHQLLTVDNERIAWEAWQARAALEVKP